MEIAGFIPTGKEPDGLGVVSVAVTFVVAPSGAQVRVENKILLATKT